MSDLSPAAQAVLDAANKAYWRWDLMHPADADAIAAAALRAAADQMTAHHSKTFLYSIADCLKLNAIATELENPNG